ncbi:unnamed protein product [Closterium sp. NIES-54]
MHLANTWARDEFHPGSLTHSCTAFETTPSVPLLACIPLFPLQVLLRESAQSISGAKDKRAAVILVPPDFCLRLLDVVADHLPRRPGEGEEGEEDGEGWQEEFINSGDYAQYRSRLMDVIRLVTQQQPLIAASKVASRIEAAVAAATSAPPPPKVVAVLEGARMLEDAVMTAVPDAVMAAAAAHSTNPAILADDLGLIVEAPAVCAMERPRADRAARPPAGRAGSLPQALPACCRPRHSQAL